MDDLAIKQYFSLIDRGIKPKKLEDMTIAEYMAYEERVKNWGGCYFPTTPSTNYDTATCHLVNDAHMEEDYKSDYLESDVDDHEITPEWEAPETKDNL